MKAIRVVEKNQAAIEAALLEVNGTATAHTYVSFGAIANVAAEAEQQVVGLVGGKAHAVGARWTETSGGAVSNSYARLGRTRVATRVLLERRASGWFLVDVAHATIWQQGGGPGCLCLTAAQAERAVTLFRQGFSVMGE